jgi:outer membrane protein OmpA-like peptidoglycan-associated protein
LALTTSGFAPGSAELPEGMANQLSTLGRALREQRAVVRVEVHTDSSGSPEHSRALSQRRAEAIRGFLIERGVDPYRVHAVGMGAQRPLLPHDPLAAENRRVEIIRL